MKVQMDKIKHFAVCLLVAATAAIIESVCDAAYSQAFLAGMIAGITIGVGKEYGDKCAIGNRWDWSDIAADALGTILGAGLGALVSFV